MIRVDLHESIGRQVNVLCTAQFITLSVEICFETPIYYPRFDVYTNLVLHCMGIIGIPNKIMVYSGNSLIFKRLNG